MRIWITNVGSILIETNRKTEHVYQICGIPTIHRRQFSVDNSSPTIRRRKILRRKIHRRKIRRRKIRRKIRRRKIRRRKIRRRKIRRRKIRRRKIVG